MIADNQQSSNASDEGSRSWKEQVSVDSIMNPDAFGLDYIEMDTFGDYECTALETDISGKKGKKRVKEKRAEKEKNAVAQRLFSQQDGGLGQERSPPMSSNAFGWAPGSMSAQPASTHLLVKQLPKELPVRAEPPAKKRGRPKSTRPSFPSSSAPNLYSVISKVTEIAQANAAISKGGVLETCAKSPSNLAMGMPTRELFSGQSDVHGHAAEKGYLWMAEKRGKRRRSNSMSVASATQLMNAAAPLLDSFASDPALLVSLGMRPNSAQHSAFPLALPLPQSPKLPLQSVRRSPKCALSNPPAAPTLPPMEAVREPPTGSIVDDCNEPSEYFMDDLFKELLNTDC